MERHLFCTALFAVILALSGPAAADGNFGVGVKAGTLGIGVEGRWSPLPWFDIRAGVNQLDYDDDGSQAGVPYDATLALDTTFATANFRFPLSPFRLTAGAYSNGNEFRLVSQDSASYDIGGSTYSGAEVGSLRGVTSFPSTAPYVGFGYDFEVFDTFGLNLDFGVLWQGDPEVSLEANGLLANDPAFRAALEDERRELLDEMEDFKAWPVLSLGFVFNF